MPTAPNASRLDGAIIPCSNDGLQCISIGFMVPQTDGTAVVWRGLMAQNAVQQVLFDLDWIGRGGEGHSGLDVVVIDMPPGTGDVQLTLGQLVQLDRAVIASTPQDAALIDTKKGVAMFRKVDVPTDVDHRPPSQHGSLYLLDLLNAAQCIRTPQILPPNRRRLELRILGELHIGPFYSPDEDSGSPTTPRSEPTGNVQGVGEVQSVMDGVAKQVLQAVVAKKHRQDWG